MKCASLIFSMPNTRSTGNEVRETIVETLEAPRLNGISAEDFVLFKQKRAIYERRVTENSSEQGVTIPTTSYYNSIDKSVLEMLVLAQWVPVSKVGETTEDHLKTCVEARAKIKPEAYGLAQVEKGIKEICMDSSLRSLEFQIWNLGLKYNQKLKSFGDSKFIATHPKLAVSHIMQRITNVQLRKRMKLSLRLHKDKLKEDYLLFMRETASEARMLDRHDAASAMQETDSDSDLELNFVDRKAGRRHRQNGQRKADRESSRTETGPQKQLRGTKSTQGFVDAKKRSRPVWSLQ